MTDQTEIRFGATKSAPPPLHSVALVVFVVILCLMYFPRPSSSMDAELFHAFTSSPYQVITTKVLAAVRLSFAFIGLGTTVTVVCIRT